MAQRIFSSSSSSSSILLSPITLGLTLGTSAFAAHSLLVRPKGLQAAQPSSKILYCDDGRSSGNSAAHAGGSWLGGDDRSSAAAAAGSSSGNTSAGLKMKQKSGATKAGRKTVYREMSSGSIVGWFLFIIFFKGRGDWDVEGLMGFVAIRMYGSRSCGDLLEDYTRLDNNKGSEHPVVQAKRRDD